MLAAALKFMDSLSQALLAVLLGIVTCIVGIDVLSATDTTFPAVYCIAIGFAASFLERAAVTSSRPLELERELSL
jgi:hypothetical protein